MGAPSSIHDSDITAPLPVPNFSVQKAKALDMHVKLSRLIAQVLNSESNAVTEYLVTRFCETCLTSTPIAEVYGVDGRLDSSFLKNIQIVLHELAGLGTELNENPELEIQPTKTIGRVPATLNLCYHQVRRSQH